MTCCRALLPLLLLTACNRGNTPAEKLPPVSPVPASTAPAKAAPARAVTEPSRPAVRTAKPARAPDAGPPGASKNPSDPFDLHRRRPPKPDPVVQADRRYVARAFVEPSKTPTGFAVSPSLRRALLRRFPDADEGPGAEPSVDLELGELQGPQQFHVIRATTAGIECLVLVIDRKARVRGKLWVPHRMRIFLRDVVGDATREVIVEQIKGTMLSFWPRTWVIYRVDRRGRLRRLLSSPRSYSYGARHERFSFLNRFDFPQKGQLRIETVLSGCFPMPKEKDMRCEGWKFSAPRKGDVRVYRYRRGRYVRVKQKGR